MNAVHGSPTTTRVCCRKIGLNSHISSASEHFRKHTNRQQSSRSPLHDIRHADIHGPSAAHSFRSLIQNTITDTVASTTYVDKFQYFCTAYLMDNVSHVMLQHSSYSDNVSARSLINLWRQALFLNSRVAMDIYLLYLTQ